MQKKKKEKKQTNKNLYNLLVFHRQNLALPERERELSSMYFGSPQICLLKFQGKRLEGKVQNVWKDGAEY